MSKVSMPDDLVAIIKRELNEGESVLWAAMPCPTYFNPAALAQFLFGIPWTAFSIFWIAGASGFKWPDFSHGFGFFPLFGLPFFFIGLGMLSAPLFTYRKSLKTAYAITDRRVITIEGGRSMVVQSYQLETLTDIHRTEGKDGVGDVVFAKVQKKNSDGDTYHEPRGFMRIANAFEVERRLKALVAERRSASAQPMNERLAA